MPSQRHSVRSHFGEERGYFSLLSFPSSLAHELLRLLKNYIPETHAEKKQRLAKIAADKAAGNEPAPAAKKNVLKCGLKHVTKLVEKKQAKLVVIADDCDPLEVCCSPSLSPCVINVV